jgi:hypothetical protein
LKLESGLSYFFNGIAKLRVALRSIGGRAALDLRAHKTRSSSDVGTLPRTLYISFHDHSFD